MGHDRRVSRGELGMALTPDGRRYRASVTQPGTTSEPVLPPGHLSQRPQPRLSAAGLTLRPWEHADAPSLVRAHEDPDIHRWHSRSMSLNEPSHGLRTSWTAGSRSAGAAGRSPGLDRCWAGSRSAASPWTRLAPKFRTGFSRRPAVGASPRALGAIADWAFDEVGFHRLELDHSTSNAASCRVATKAGFVPEGTKRSQALHLDGWHDMHAHGLLAHDARPRCRDVRMSAKMRVSGAQSGEAHSDPRVVDDQPALVVTQHGHEPTF